ncbi:mitochondrial fission factor homolog B-like [Branchiostoma floridae]|uniref:Mitochondrial fission factor n=1 Tax=Branchiostoma floridae TaxID=7739 RepID=A0A9J7HHL2_BRAFL|nr:mitochondrial fission factor homolog B-like [Branchiostoma floridae]
MASPTKAFNPPEQDLDTLRYSYNAEYTADISTKMRVPDKIQVAEGDEGYAAPSRDDSRMLHHSMDVPDRIMVAGEGQYKGQHQSPRTLDLDTMLPSQPPPVSLQTPPRTLTLEEHLDSLEIEERPRSRPRTASGRKEPLTNRGMPNGIAIPESQQNSADYVFIDTLSIGKHHPLLEWNAPLIFSVSTPSDAAPALPNMDAVTPMAEDEVEELRRQLSRVGRRLRILEDENEQRNQRELILYSVTLAFWLINAWMYIRRD